MRTIPIEFVRIDPTFKSLTTAINHAVNYPPLAQAKKDAASVLGVDIKDGYWNDCDFVIRFANNTYRHVFVGQESKTAQVRWSFTSVQPPLTEEAIECIGAPPVIFKTEKREFIVDASQMFSSRLDKPLSGVWVTEGGFYVYTPGQKILCFARAYDQFSQRNILYVYEDD